MARGINKVILIGHLGADPETRYMPSGGAVTNVNLATSETWKDKQTGQPQERTEWHRVVFFNRLAEIAGECLRKGSKVYIEGSLRTRKWQDKNTGQDRYTTEIVAANLQMLDSPTNNPPAGQPAPQPQGRQQPPQRDSAARAPGAQGGAPAGYAGQGEYAQQPPPMAPPGGFDNSFDDDMPF